MVDIDGVVSLFGFPPNAPPEGTLHWIDGIPHFLSAAAARHLLGLAGAFELVWCSGWEERANEHLPHLLGLPGELPFLSFERGVGDAEAGASAKADAEVGAGAGATKSMHGHWKLHAIGAFAGARPLAWIDDCIDAACHAWAAARAAPTLLVQTSSEHGLTDTEAAQLTRWAQEQATSGA